MITVIVTTREGDKFTGVYNVVPTREQVIEGIRANSTDVNFILRLLNIVKQTRSWPTKVTTRRAEVVRVDSLILGKVVFTPRAV